MDPHGQELNTRTTESFQIVLVKAGKMLPLLQPASPPHLSRSPVTEQRERLEVFHFYPHKMQSECAPLKQPTPHISTQRGVLLQLPTSFHLLQR